LSSASQYDLTITPDAHGLVHAPAVCLSGAAALIVGPSGSGKSGLALQLIALGGTLISDDRVFLEPCDGGAIAKTAPNIAGQIEARGLGILAAPHVSAVPVGLVVDLGRQETDRLPPFRWAGVAGSRLPLVHNVGGCHFPAAIALYMSGGRTA